MSEELDKSDILKDLISVSNVLSGERNINALSEKIVNLALKITNSDGGTFYTTNIDEETLVFKYVTTKSLNIQMGGTSGHAIDWGDLPLYVYDNTLQKVKNTSMVAVKCALEKHIINIKDIYTDSNFNFKGTKNFDKGNNYRSDSMLVVPLLDHENETIGVLQLINKKDENNNNIQFSQFDEEMTKALAAQVGAVLLNTILIAELEEFMDQFIESVSRAIDKKSPFTGGHIKQVEKVALILAKAVSNDEKYFKDIKYSEKDFKLFELASWLHDIGKISVPEHIIDKATKLETVFDRIEVIQERFEILKRDAEIEFLNKKIELLQTNKTDLLPEIQEEFDNKILIFQKLYDLINKTNTGTEWLNSDVKGKLFEISKNKYKLQGKYVNLLRGDEVENLLIERGTLNEEEREIIKGHGAITYEMLKNLPFPKKYQKVINMASNHHETLNGKGYPRQLRAEQLSIEDRIVAVADIFEALTAKDRPYKQPKKLSEVVKIMSLMIKDEHLDERLIRIMFEEKAYLEYLQELNPSQIDTDNPKVLLHHKFINPKK